MDGGCDPATAGVGMPLRDHGEGRSSQWVGPGEEKALLAHRGIKIDKTFIENTIVLLKNFETLLE